MVADVLQKKKEEYSVEGQNDNVIWPILKIMYAMALKISVPFTIRSIIIHRLGEGYVFQYIFFTIWLTDRSVCRSARFSAAAA